MSLPIAESARQTDVLGEYDVLVAGGGIVGVAAAIAATRNCCGSPSSMGRTAMIQRIFSVPAEYK